MCVPIAGDDRRIDAVWGRWGDQTADYTSKKALERVEAVRVWVGGIFPMDRLKRGKKRGSNGRRKTGPTV